MNSMIVDSKRIKTLKKAKEVLKYERTLYPGYNWIKSVFGVCENAVLYRYIIFLRKAEWATNTKNKIIRFLCGRLFRLRLQRMQNKTGIIIPINTCEKGLKIQHLQPMIINPNASV